MSKHSKPDEVIYYIEEESPSFFCKPRRKVYTMEKCMSDFMQANAFEKRRSVCWRCSYGRKNREAFAEG
jgi:hypothetical protein